VKKSDGCVCRSLYSFKGCCRFTLYDLPVRYLGPTLSGNEFYACFHTTICWAPGLPDMTAWQYRHVTGTCILTSNLNFDWRGASLRMSAWHDKNPFNCNRSFKSGRYHFEESAVNQVSTHVRFELESAVGQANRPFVYASELFKSEIVSITLPLRVLKLGLSSRRTPYREHLFIKVASFLKSFKVNLFRVFSSGKVVWDF